MSTRKISKPPAKAKKAATRTRRTSRRPSRRAAAIASTLTRAGGELERGTAPIVTAEGASATPSTMPDSTPPLPPDVGAERERRARLDEIDAEIDVVPIYLEIVSDVDFKVGDVFKAAIDAGKQAERIAHVLLDDDEELWSVRPDLTGKGVAIYAHRLELEGRALWDIGAALIGAAGQLRELATVKCHVEDARRSAAERRGRGAIG